MRWLTELEDIRRGLDHPSALVASTDVLDRLPPLSREQLADAASGGERSVWRRQLLCALAARMLDMAPAAVRLGVGSNGLRMLIGTDVFASVAYRSGVAAAAISHAPIGIDIESIEEASAAKSVALEGFSDDMGALTKWHGPAGVWAAKESALKASSKDLTNSTDRWRFGDMTVSHDTDAEMRVSFLAFKHVVAAVSIYNTADYSRRYCN